MQQAEVITTLNNYDLELNGILSRFVHLTQSITINRSDEARLKQLLVELKDFFEDVFVDGVRYSRSISIAYTEGVSNFLGSPSYYSVETIKSVVAGSATRVARNPQCLKSESQSSSTMDDAQMDFTRQCNENVTVERLDGTRYEDIKVMVNGRMVLVPDSTIPIAIGDFILRPLPSGIVERLVVTDPGFFAKHHGSPAHYQVKYRHEGQKPQGSPGYVIHASNNSHVNINSTDNSVNQTDNSNCDLSALANELSTLRDALVKVATLPEHYIAIGNISSAELAAKSGSNTNVGKALSALGEGGKWALGAAKEIGVSLATETIKSYVGTP